jgi:tetratricopeptide (TPR) repeat protein
MTQDSTPSSGKESSRKTRSYLLLTTVFLVSFVVYFNTLFNGFVMDDHFQVLENRWIRDVRYIPEMFTRGVWEFKGEVSSYYRPMMHVMYLASHHVFGLRPWGFHLVNILLHGGVSVLVLLVLFKLLKESDQTVPIVPAFVASMLFTTHPIHTEAVAWVAGISDLSFAFFSLLAFLFHIRSHEGMKGGQLLAAASFFAATLCKEPAFTLPVILIAYDIAVRKQKEGIARYLKRYIPYALGAGVSFVLRINALKTLAPWKAPSELSPAEYALQIPFLFARYVEKLLLPINLNNWHFLQPPTSLLSAEGIVNLAATAAFLGALVFTARRARMAFLGLLMIVVPLLPTFYLPALTQGIQHAFTERYLYFPSVGFSLLAALLIVWTEDRRPTWTTALLIALSMIVLLYSGATLRRNAVWRDSYTLWSDAARKSPGSAEPHNALGDYFKETGRIDEAIAQYRIGVRLSPQTPHIHANLGVAHAMKGRTAEAIEQIKTALLLWPGFTYAHDSLGVIYAQTGRYDEAVREFQIAVGLNPSFEDAYRHLGIAYGDMGHTDKAIEYLKKALDLNPDDVDAHNDLGIAYGKKGLMHDAMEHFEAAVRMQPGDPDYRYNLARAYESLGLSEKANDQIRRAQDLTKSDR